MVKDDMKPVVPFENLSDKNDFVVIDARGHRCPVPTLKLRRHFEESGRGQGVILIANDPMAQIDVPHFCNQNNYVLISVEAKCEAWFFTVGSVP
jgi:tRNA 2-thiouridine synthesizing protein A